MKNNSIRKNRSSFHTPPIWVDQHASFFITINCKTRETNQIAKEPQFQVICDTAKRFMDDKRWLPEILVVMPDHVHTIASFPWGDQHAMGAVIRDFKRFTARNCGIAWQRDYFDHRIRSEADHQEKWLYIIENPVRADITKESDDWPFIWRA